MEVEQNHYKMNINNLINPVNLKEWVNKNRHLLKPPVANKVVWENGDFIVMVVGGPNSRKDFHYNETPEFFYQVEGDIILKIIDNDKQEDITIKEGEIYLLPPKVYHSPQRRSHYWGPGGGEPLAYLGLAWPCVPLCIPLWSF